MAKSLTPRKFQEKILAWFDLHGRKNLPWQHDISPYRVWISEIMLQQTQVTTVIPYYDRFMQCFSDINKLASAPIDEVLHFWTGLGYYARAHNLHKTALIIKNDFKGVFPQQFSEIVTLPGIGRSTAGAICAIALKQHYSILDGNVKRVLARFAMLEGWAGKPKIADKFWQVAEHYTPAERVADYTQAIMDLGATLCTRSQPKCDRCPLETYCLAHQQQCEMQYPGKKPKKTLLIKKTIMLLIKNSSREWLLEKRPNTGIWGGLWLFPQCKEIDEIQSWCYQHDISIKAQRLLPEFRHTFSHYHLNIQPILVETTKMKTKIMNAQQFIWYNHEQAIGLAAPVKKLLIQLKETA